MTQPYVRINQVDGALGVATTSGRRLLALVGPSTGGPIGVPATFASVRQLLTVFRAGPLVEAAAHAIDVYGAPVVVVRAASDAGTLGTLDDDAVNGTSAITIDGTPFDHYDVVVEVATGGTVGTAGAAVRFSLDRGASFSSKVPLGTSNALPIGDTGLTVHFGAGTLSEGDYVTVSSTAPGVDGAALQAALTALGASQVSWEIVSIVSPITSAAQLSTIDTALRNMAARGKYRAFIATFRTPNAGESEAAYAAAFSTAFASAASTYGAVTAGAAAETSAVSGYGIVRPVSFDAAPREQSLEEHINSANTDLPASTSRLTDVNGNPVHHDESLNPGLDDARAYVLRTWDSGMGIFPNRPRAFSPVGSDFEYLSHRRVINLAATAAREYFIRRVNIGFELDPKTGFILPSEASEMKKGAEAKLAGVLLAAPKASGVKVVVGTTDNVLQTKTLRVVIRVLPLGYVEYIEIELSFATQLSAAA